MKERPILFSGPMVRAILDGRKTQTRRLVKLPPTPYHLGTWEATTIGGPGTRYADGSEAPEQVAIWHTRTGQVISCPYGDPGDRLWVRETWGPCAGGVVYRADDYASGHVASPDGARWRPSIHMPRWASRVLLEIIDVRVQRLQDIIDVDIIAEGVTAPVVSAMTGIPWSSIPDLHTAWRYGWDHINAKRAPWSANPWVWAVTFVRVDEKAGMA